MPLNRRQLARIGLTAGVMTALRPTWAFGRGIEPTPDFSLDSEPRYLAGLRPCRDGTFRLEAEILGDRLLAHNYGHGGAGITMSWGVALEVRDMVTAWDAARPADASRNVAVLGSGVMGMTAATLLVEAGYGVTVYAKGFLDETTSAIAGGQFNPSRVEFTADADGTARFQRILRRSFRTHESKLGQGFGVVRRRNYTWNRSRTFDLIPRDVVPEPEAFPRLPFEGHQNRPGFCYQTLLIEPPIFLRRLDLDLRLAGVRMIRRTFESLDHILDVLDHDVLVNCLGLGAGAVMNDPAVVPARGQLVLLKPQPHLHYLYGGDGYIFPRSDAVVVGGTFERGESDATPDPVMCADILARAKAPFSGLTLGPAPAWMAPD